MELKNFVLYDMQIKDEPLFVEFKDNVLDSNKDQIICDITIEQALKILDYSFEKYIENHIYIPTDVERYLKEFKKEKKQQEQEREMWKQIEKTEKVVQELIEERKRKEKN